jgi:hypothetical protein
MEDPYQKPLPEATAIASPSADQWAAQGQPLPVYAQPLNDENELDQHAFAQVHHGGGGLVNSNSHDAEEDDEDEEEEGGGTAARHGMRRDRDGFRGSFRATSFRSASSRENDEVEIWQHGGNLVIVAKTGLGTTGTFRLSVLCFVYSIFAFAVVCLEIEWMREDAEQRERYDALSDDQKAAIESDEYDPDGDDDYWTSRRESRVAAENFESIFRVFSFVMYCVLLFSQRAISNLREMYCQDCFVSTCRIWGVFTFAAIIAMMTQRAAYEDAAGDGDWNTADDHYATYGAVRLTSDITDVVFFMFGAYVFYRTTIRKDAQQQRRDDYNDNEPDVVNGAGVAMDGRSRAEYQQQ